MKPNITLKTVGDVAFIVACVVLTGLAVWRFLPKPAAAGAAGTTGARIEQERVGTKMPALTGVDPAAAKATVVVFVTSTCRYCEASMPFYRKLAAHLAENGGAQNLVFASWETTQVTDAVLTAHDVKGPRTVQLPGASGIQGTPTLFIADATGTVVNSWLGKLAERQEAEVMDALQTHLGGRDPSRR